MRKANAEMQVLSEKYSSMLLHHSTSVRGHWKGCIAIGLLVITFLSMGKVRANDENFLEDIKRAGLLTAKYENIRGNAITDGSSVELDQLISSLAYSSNTANDEKLLRFFMRGASGYPVVKGTTAYLVFYNPLADVSVVTSWRIIGKDADLVDAKMLVGERLQLVQFLQSEPRWMGSEILSDGITGLGDRFHRDVSNTLQFVISAIERMMIWDGGLKESARTGLRVALMALGTSDKIMPCGAAISDLSADVDKLILASGSTNIKADPSVQLISAGGITADGLNVRFYSTIRNAADIVMVVADERKNCEISSTIGFSALTGE